MKSLPTFTIATLTAVMLGAPASGAAADDGMITYHLMTQVVRLADLDLAEQNDAQELLQRLQIAARKSCKRSSWTRDRDPFHIDRKHCRNIAYKNAVTEIDSHFNINLLEIAGVSYELATIK